MSLFTEYVGSPTPTLIMGDFNWQLLSNVPYDARSDTHCNDSPIPITDLLYTPHGSTATRL